MRSLTVELFKFLYTISRQVKISYYLALVLISVLDIFVLQGLALLLVDMFPTKPLLMLFRVPFVFGLGTGLFFLNYRITGPKIFDIADVIKTKYSKILIYFAVAIILFLYSSLIGRLF